jgi:hypothetical protein
MSAGFLADLLFVAFLGGFALLVWRWHWKATHVTKGQVRREAEYLRMGDNQDEILRQARAKENARKAGHSGANPQAPIHQQSNVPPPAAAAGWYPDPNGGASQRYWDGRAWAS